MSIRHSVYKRLLIPFDKQWFFVTAYLIGLDV